MKAYVESGRKDETKSVKKDQNQTFKGKAFEILIRSVWSVAIIWPSKQLKINNWCSGTKLDQSQIFLSIRLKQYVPNKLQMGVNYKLSLALTCL